MKPLVVAPAPFKAALAAPAAARAIAAGVRLGAPGVQTRVVPVADGGEGTLDALVGAAGGRSRSVPAVDPLGRPIDARLGELPGGVAVVELAQAAGFELLAETERDPEATTTAGVGMLIRAALDLGVSRVIVGLGGSATTDGGLGLACELGVRALDADGNDVPARGGDLGRVASLDLSGRDPRLDAVALEVACDVDNPFHGPAGAARAFGPQKGASAAAVERLDAGLANLAGAVATATGADLQRLPGAGAAGGAAGGLATLLGGRLVPGARLVLDAVDFERSLEDAGLCITGEGRIDATTTAGKAPAAVAAICARAGVPCLALCGEVALGPRCVRELGLVAALPIGRRLRDLAEARAATEQDLAASGAAVGALYAAGLGLTPPATPPPPRAHPLRRSPG